jgi:nitrate reductase alpha subunit
VNHPNQKNDESASLSVEPRKRDIGARQTDSPSFAKFEEKGGVCETGRFLRAGEAARHHYEENGERKFLAHDSLSNEAQTPGGFAGHRRNNEPRKWNLELKDTRDGSQIDSLLSFIDHGDGVGKGPTPDSAPTESSGAVLQRGGPKYKEQIDSQVIKRPAAIRQSGGRARLLSIHRQPRLIRSL